MITIRIAFAAWSAVILSIWAYYGAPMFVAGPVMGGFLLGCLVLGVQWAVEVTG